MKRLVKTDETLVESVSLYTDKHWLLHAYVLPFAVVYAIWFQAWLFADFYGYSLEAGLVTLGAIFFVQVLVVLGCHWSVHVMAFVTCSKVYKPAEATFAKFVPTANNGSAELVRVHRSVRSGDIWCMFQKLKYLWNERDQVFAGLEFPVNRTFEHYLQSKGHDEESALVETKRVFGDNK